MIAISKPEAKCPVYVRDIKQQAERFLYNKNRSANIFLIDLLAAFFVFASELLIQSSYQAAILFFHHLHCRLKQ